MVFGKKMKEKGVLFATNDKWLMPILKNRDVLEKKFIFPMSNGETIKKCLDKKLMYKEAKAANISIPKTISVDSCNELEGVIQKISYPCILKPSLDVKFEEKLKLDRKTIHIKNKEHLIRCIKRFKEIGAINVRIIIQEIIPGDAKQLYTISCYSNTEGRIVAYSIGHKIRQYPPDAGTILSGHVIPHDELFELADRFIQRLGFYGISNIEFKQDPRDNTFKLMEINARPGMWNYSATASGVNLFYYLYSELMGKKYNDVFSSSKELIWTVLSKDFYYSLFGFKRKGYKEYSLSLNDWLKSLKGKKVFAILSFKDPLPCLAQLVHLIQGKKV